MESDAQNEKMGKNAQRSRALASVRPVRSHCLSKYSYALSARAPTDTDPICCVSNQVVKLEKGKTYDQLVSPSPWTTTPEATRSSMCSSCYT